jgi:hypothetical protein
MAGVDSTGWRLSSEVGGGIMVQRFVASGGMPQFTCFSVEPLAVNSQFRELGDAGFPITFESFAD